MVGFQFYYSWLESKGHHTTCGLFFCGFLCRITCGLLIQCGYPGQTPTKLLDWMPPPPTATPVVVFQYYFSDGCSPPYSRPVHARGHQAIALAIPHLPPPPTILFTSLFIFCGIIITIIVYNERLHHYNTRLFLIFLPSHYSLILGS